MSIGISLLEVIIFGVFISAVFSGAKKRNRYTSFKSASKNHQTFSKSTVRTLPQKDFIRNYSSKSKDCHEDEVKVSSLDEKPRRRKSLWNEPSWDDELYS